MTTLRLRNAVTFKQKAISVCMLTLLKEIQGTLTEGASVTADSIYYGHAGYNNCIGALVDGKFYPLGFEDGSKCCAHTSPTTNYSLFSIDMGAQTIVQTVLIINREEFNAVDDRIIGSDFHVGDSSLPFNNTLVH